MRRGGQRFCSSQRHWGRWVRIHRISGDRDGIGRGRTRNRLPILLLPALPEHGLQTRLRERASSCPGPVPRCQRAMLLMGGHSRATPPAPTRAHPCSCCSHPRVLTPRAATLLQIPLPAQPGKHGSSSRSTRGQTRCAQRRSPCRVTPPNQKPPQRCLQHPGTWLTADLAHNLAAIVGQSRVNPGPRHLIPPEISQIKGRFGNRDQHQLVGLDAAAGILPCTTSCSWSS